VDINRALESTTQNIKASATESLGYYELKQLKLWFDKQYSNLLDQMKQTNFQSFQNKVVQMEVT